MTKPAVVEIGGHGAKTVVPTAKHFIDAPLYGIAELAWPANARETLTLWNGRNASDADTGRTLARRG